MNNVILERHHVNINGQGSKLMIFAPGFGCDQNMWRFVAPAFMDRYRTVQFDYVGSGKSDLRAYSSDKYCNLDGYAQDVLQICDELDAQGAIFVGHSVGSMIGILASIREPDLFERMVLVGPSPYYINEPPDYVGGFEREDLEGLLDLMEKNYIGWSRFLAPLVMQNKERPELTDELRDSFCSTDPIVARDFARTTFFSDNRLDVKKVTVPSLIIQCTDDAIAPMEVGHYMHRNMNNSHLKIIQATGHCPHLSHPEETISCIREFITQCL
jgi:sigma-B regulation protein RsbQ